MSKTFISYRGYGLLKSAFDIDELEDIRKDLTVSPRDTMNLDAKPKNFTIYTESNTKLYIPKFYGLQKYGIPDEESVSSCQDISLHFNGQLRDYQVEPVQKVLSACKDPEKMGSLLSLACGMGKTSCALYIASKLGKKTLVVAHKGFLIDQWRERISQFLPTAKVGLIKAQILDVEDKDIVLASLQSLAMKDYDKKIFQDFGLLIVDETHHLGSEVFSRALQKATFKYSIGLSATPTRKDGLTKVFKWHIGPIAYKGKKKEDELHVIYKEYHNIDPKYSKEATLYNNKPLVPTMISNIAAFEPRTDYIIQLLLEVLKKEPGRKTIILSDRRAHLEIFMDKLVKLNLGEIRYAVGGLKQKELDKNMEECDILLATFALVEEAFDLPKLNTLVMASPKSTVEQTIGRIQRQLPHERKYVPLVIDICDMFSIFPHMAKKRLTFYQKNKYDVKRDDEQVKVTKKVELSGFSFSKQK